MMNKKREVGILVALVLGAFAIRLWLALQPTSFLVEHLLADDAYYYFKMAENVARGLGTSFDGIHLTNGFHPIWMGLISLVYSAFRHLPLGSDQPIHVLLASAALVNVLTAVPIYFFLKRLTGVVWLRLLGTALFLFNPWSIAHGLNGLETTVANLFLAITVWLAVEVLEQPTSRAKITALSFVAAFTILGRLDYGIYVLILGIGMLMRLWRVWRWREYVAALVPGLLLLVGWVVYATLFLSGPIPQSGLASTLVNKELFFYKVRPAWQTPVWSVYKWWGAIQHAAGSSGASWLLWIVIALFGVRVAVDFKKRLPWKATSFVLLCVILGLLGQTFLHGAVRWFSRDWYFSFGTVVFAYAFVWGIERSTLSWRRAFLPIALVVACFFMTNPLARPYFLSQQEMYQAAFDVQSMVPSTARIGAFNAGIYGYYTGRTVINLDGLVNTSAYHALRDKRLREYLKTERIDYLLDYDIAWQYRYAPFFGTTDFSFLTPVRTLKENSLYHGATLMLYKVD